MNCGEGEPEVITVPLRTVVIDEQVLIRPLHRATAEDYAEVLEHLPHAEAVRLPDGALLLVDGRHRHAAHEIAERDEITLRVWPGTRRDAILRGAIANASHGRPLTRAEKREAVDRCLSDAEMAALRDREIGRRTGTSHGFVAGRRKCIGGNVTRQGSQEPPSPNSVIVNAEADSSGGENRPSPGCSATEERDGGTALARAAPEHSADDLSIVLPVPADPPRPSAAASPSVALSEPLAGQDNASASQTSESAKPSTDEHTTPPAQDAALQPTEARRDRRATHQRIDIVDDCDSVAGSIMLVPALARVAHAEASRAGMEASRWLAREVLRLLRTASDDGVNAPD